MRSDDVTYLYDAVATQGSDFINISTNVGKNKAVSILMVIHFPKSRYLRR